MVENNMESIDKAQNGAAEVNPVPTQLNVETPMVNRLDLEDQFGGYRAPGAPEPLPTYKSPDNIYPDPTILSGRGGEDNSLEAWENYLSTKSEDKPGGSVMRTLAEVSSNRYDNFVPGDYNNEDAYAQNQSFGEKMINGVGKGLLLTSTTFLQGTVGLVNGLVQWGADGRFASFYDNEFNRSLDELLKKSEDALPNFYTDVEKNAKWYSPDYFMTGNFLWDGVVKNMGFAAGAYFTGGVYSMGLRGLAALPGASRLLSMGRAAEAVAASEEALLAVDKGTEAYGKIKALSDSYLRTYNVLDKGHRAVVAGLSTSGEAGFEAYHNLNDFRNAKIEKYRNEHNGQDPQGADLEKINADADSIGNTSFALNVALLSATNYIQFPKVLGSSYKAEKGILNNVTRNIGDITKDATGKYIAVAPKSKALALAKRVGPYLFAPSEAFEESAQYAIQMGTQDYYNKKYDGKATDWMSSVGAGLQAGFASDEGAKNALIGGLSGAIMMSRGTYLERKDKAENTAKAIEAFNKYALSDFTKETMDSVNRGTVLQEERERLLKEGNITESKDKETDYIINYLTPRIKYGRMDLVAADIADQRKLASTDEGFNQLVAEGKALATDTKEAYLQRLNNFEQTANNVKSLYQSLSLRYGGQVDEDGKPLYSPAVIDKLIYAATKISDYEQRIPKVSQQLIGVVDNIDQILLDVAEGNFESFNDAMAKIETNKKLNSTQKEDLTGALDDIGFMGMKRDLFLKEYDAIKKSPKDFQVEDVVDTTLPDDTPKETVTIKTKNGDRKIEIGTEYVLGKVTEYSAGGSEVYRQPRLTVLGVNPDGTIKIKTSNGKIKDVSVEEFESYSLTPASKMLTDKKFNYFEKHQNTVFRNYNIKKSNGDPVEGRLEYNNKKDKLTFVYVDENGKVQRTEVWNTMFKAAEGYAGASIRPIGTLTAVQQQAENEFVNGETTVSQKLQTRNRIITDLYEKGVKRLEEINKKLANSKAAVEKEEERLKEEIAKESLTKAGKVRKRPTTVLKQLINTLANLRDTVEKENNALKEEKAELEATVPYFKEFLDSLETLPQNSVKMIKQLKEDINALEDLIDNTNDAIKSSESLLEQIDDMLKEALSIFNDYIKRLKEENPTVPLFIEDLQANVERFLGEEGARMFIENRQGFTEKVLELESDINDFSDELKIPELSKKSEDLVKEISNLKTKLDDLIAQQLAKATILETFEQFAEDEANRKAEEQKMRDNEKLKRNLLGTLTNAVQNFFGTASYEAMSKKDDLEVVGSTKPAADDIPHQQRANFFGNKLETFENKDQLRGMIVTANTEDDIMPGLTEDFLKDMPEGTRKEEAKKQIIYMVMVQDNQDGTFSVVDQNGQPILEDGDKINNAVYQVFPNTDLTASFDGETYSMFRKETEDGSLTEVQESLKEQYKQWAADQLSKVELTGDDMQQFSASFGQPKLVTVKNQAGEDVVDKGARTSAQAAGLVTQSGLRKDPVITVATSNDSVTEGSVTFATPTGRVFLKIPGRGLAKLFNRKFNKKEAETIFDVLHQITKNALRDGEINESSDELFNWLKSVTYWGIAKYADGKPKPAGYNNIWFKTVKENGQDVVKLFMSGLAKDSTEYFEFTPTGLQNSKDAIIMLLQEMYNNTDSLKVNGDSWSNPYYEITGIDTEGNPIKTEWPNYQTYLLSDKAPGADGKLTVARTGKELPLATQFRPITESQPINREGIYFTLNDTSSTYTKPEPVVVASQPVAATAAPFTPTASSTQSTEEFNDDGETLNMIIHPVHGDVHFTLDKAGVVTIDQNESADAIISLSQTKIDQGLSKAEAENWAINNFMAGIANKIAQSQKAQAAATTNVDPISFDNETPNTIETPYGPVTFLADEQGEVTLVDEADSNAAIDKLAADKNKDRNRAGNILAESIKAKIATQLVQQQVPNLPPVADSTLSYKVGDIITINTPYGLQEVEITAIDETKPLVANYLSYKYVNKVTNDKGQTVTGGNMNQKSFEDSIQVQPAQVQTQDQLTEVKKAEIEKKVNSLPDNLLFITHITSQGNAINIFNSSLLMPAGVSSTTGIVSKEQLKQILFELADGQSRHRGYLDMFIGAIDRTTLESVNGKTLQDKLENYLDENFIEDVAKRQLPSSLNIGYFTDGVLNTKYDSKTSEAKPTEGTTVSDIEKRKQEDLSKLETLELGDTFAPKGTVSEKLLEIGKFFQNNFGWKFEGNREYPLYVSKENNRAEFDINGLEVNLEEGQTFRLMGGAAYPTFTPQELVEAKYKAELAALKGGEQTTPVQTENDGDVTTTPITVNIPELKTVKVDLVSLSIEELKNVAKQLRQKAVNARAAEKKGTPVLGGSQMIEDDYQAIKKYISDLENETKTSAQTEDGDVDWNTPVRPGGRRRLFRLAPLNKVDEVTPENWQKLEAFFKKAIPNVPFYRVMNMIRATNGREAYGMLHDGAVYVYEGAEIGTGYHEVFEAIWKMFAGPEEKQAIINEFRNRKGSYVDRFTGETIEYAKATPEQLKEELAEEFRDAVLADKLGEPLASKGLIGRLFSQLIDYIKAFFTGKSAQINTKELFNKIGSGYFAQYNPYETKLSYATKGIQDLAFAEGDETSDYRLKIKNIPAQQIHDIIQQMTYNTLSDLAERKQSLFEVQKPKKNELYARLKVSILRDCILQYKADLNQEVKKGLRTIEEITPTINNLGDLFEKIKEEWPAIVQKHEEHLKTYSIEFDENDELNVNDEDNSGKGDYVDARKVDSFRKSNTVVKLLLATLPKTSVVNGEIREQISTIGGVTLMPADQAFITLMNALHNSVNPVEMFERLRTMAKGNPNYDVLYRRLTNGSPLNKPVNWDSMQEHDLQLMTAFWNAMKKQNADVVTVFILPSGEVVIGNSVLSGAARQAKREMINKISESVRGDQSKYFYYDKKTQKYNPTPFLNAIKFNSGQLGQYVAFLQGMGIEFKLSDIENKNKLNYSQLKLFREAVEGIHKSFTELEDVASITPKTLNIDKRLTQLGTVKAILENPDFESTYYNINGERTQSFIGINAISTLHDVLSQLTNIKQLATAKYNSYGYLLTDVFTKDSSVMLERMFDLIEDEKGNVNGGRIAGTEDLMKPVFVDGTINEQTGNKKESSKLSAKQRFLQGINLNIAGIYENLVPGDASIEHAIKMHNEMFGKDPDSFITEETFNNGKHLEIFRKYFMAEVNLARDNRKVVKGKNSNDLRFFKAILGDTLHNQIMSKANSKKSAEKLYEENKTKIDAAVNSFIAEDANTTELMLRNFGAVSTTAEGIETEGLSFSEDQKLSKVEFENKLKVLSVNYMIANIEMHKLLYSDPYQYSDELKRIKNFNSPRQAMLYGSPQVNASLSDKYNRGYAPEDIGYTDMNIDHFISSVIDDVFSTDELDEYLKPYEETDGGGYIILKATRVFLLRTGQWNDAKEKQYRYDVAYEKTVKGEGLTEAEKKAQGLILTAEEKAFNIKKTNVSGEIKYVGKNPGVKSLYTAIKPVVSGNTADGQNYNNIVLDKFALVPLSFRILHEINPESNAIKHYNKMQRENIDYTVYGTGRKVGAGETTPLYLPSGEYNEASFAETNNIPFSIMGLQTEVPSKDNPVVTQGSQITKLVTMDFMEAGIPIDFEVKDKEGNVIEDINERFVAWNAIKTEEAKEKASPLYKEIANNQKLLEAKIEQGYKTLLQRLGIVQTKEGFDVLDKDRLIKTLRDEILKREVNDNIIDALEGYKDGDVVLEATPAYQQIRNILYSIADKQVVRPKISGGMKVQISSTLFESTRIKGEEFKDKNGVTKYRYSSNILKFYKNKDGERVCEIMISRWFDNEQTKNMTDKELLDYLNTTEEGKAILAGIGYRIPTQKQNSIDSFVVKQFLPKDFGDNVVVPSALVKKVGSDFDIDKLSIYLKNVFTDAKGKLRLVPFLGYGQEAIDKFKEIAIENNNAEIYKQAKSVNKSKDIYELFQSIIDGTADEYTRNKWLPIITDWFPEQVQDGSLDANEVQNRLFRTIEEKQVKLGKLTDETLTEIWAESQAELWYKQSLENAYIQSLQNLVSHELNFNNLVKPNSAKEMEDLSKQINAEMGNTEIDYGAVGNMLSRSFMSSLRQAFVSGKYAIGIAATGQTNHADNQRTATYIDLDKLDGVDPVDREVLGGNPNSTIFATDPNINFEEYNSIVIDGVKRPTLAMVKNKAGKYISDIIGQFIDGYVDISKGPWIMRLGATPNVASTWLFLIKLGVPADTVGYFMNQPIIKDYLNTLENNGYTWLFNDSIMSDKLDAYEPGVPVNQRPTVSGIPSKEELFKMLKYNKAGMKDKMDDVQKLQQQYILKEFIKYSKMSSQLFDVVQGSNLDTATINDPYLVFKKMLQLEKARKSIISSVDKLLNSSFKGVLKNAIFDTRDAFAQILISDKANVRSVMEAVLTPYVKLSDREFVKVSQKAVNDLFDWAVQTDRSINVNVANILLGNATTKSAAQQIIDFRDSILGNKNKGISAKTDHPLFNNIILNSIKMEPGAKEGKADNLYIGGRDNKVYDQNLIIYGFEELKKGLGAENKDLYGKLVRLAVIQSGLTNSPIAFTNLLPYKDFKELYNQTLSNLENLPNLADFQTLHVFERNNWNNSTIMPFIRAKMKLGRDYRTGQYNIYDPNQHFIDANLKNAMNNGMLPKIIGISPYGDARKDFVTYSWESDIPIGEKNKRRKAGDYSYLNKVLLQKVYTTNDKGERVPLVQETRGKDGRVYTKHIFKAINAWGDSYRAQEFYDYERSSALDNGYDKVERVTDVQGKQIKSGEVSDEEVVRIFRNEVAGETSIAQPTTEGVTLKDGNTYTADQLNTKMLLAMGYTKQEAGEIIKNNKC